LGEIRKAMNNVYVHRQRQEFLPRTPDGNPISFVRQSLASDFEPVILTLPQVLDILDGARWTRPARGPRRARTP